MADKKDWLLDFLDIKVVLDMDTGHILIGQLLEIGPDHLIFSNADLHDCKGANSTKEVYLIEAEQHGINVNRQKVAVPRHRMMAISKLEDAVIR